MKSPAPAASYLLGCDTGGTYTDAVVVEAAGHRVVAAAKALTTKGDLAIGVTEAIRNAIANLPTEIEPNQIQLVSVSTTLATNAVVEGHGSRVGVLLVGFDPEMVERTNLRVSFPDAPLAVIAGGHDHNGDAREALDVEAVDAAADTMAVDAFAVAGMFAVRNPAHEQAVRDRLVERTGKPVTISTELTSQLEAPRRAVNAVLNARLISRVSTLIDAVSRAMTDVGVACPLMVVKGDGTVALADVVAKRPIETVLSGPAASLVGAAWLSGLDRFVLSDMGGTTTDLAAVTDGRPVVLEHGANVGGWRTMVRAVDVQTIGLGGDSEVHVDTFDVLTVGPERVIPVSLLALRHPEIIGHLESGAKQFVLHPFGTDYDLLLDRAGDEFTPAERDLLDAVADRPRPIRDVASSSFARRALGSLRRRSLVQVSGFTPSDAAHVLGYQSTWSKPAAVSAAKSMIWSVSAEDFSRRVWDETVRRSGRAVLDVVLRLDPDGGNRTGASVSPDTERLLDAVCTGERTVGHATIAITPSLPVVAVGGPVRVFYPEVGARLGCEVVFPEHFSVANAVGAATGLVARTVVVEVQRGTEEGFRVHRPDGVTFHTTGAAALEAAIEAACSHALAEVTAMGATDPQVRHEIKKDWLPMANDDNGLLQAWITAEAIGRPT